MAAAVAAAEAQQAANHTGTTAGGLEGLSLNVGFAVKGMVRARQYTEEQEVHIRECRLRNAQRVSRMREKLVPGVGFMATTENFRPL